MRRLTFLAAILCLTSLTLAADKPGAAAAVGATNEEGFVSLFDGKSLDGWTPQDPALAKAFRVEDGTIVCNGQFTHLFYSGPVKDHTFKNFELRAEFKMGKSSNSGIFFHTENPGPGTAPNKQKKVEKGYECQICGESFTRDPKKTGSLYDVEDVKESAAKEDEWSTYVIRVEGKHIVLQVNGKTTVDYTEPTPPNRKKGREGRVISSGTFALQAHDPGSTCAFRNIRVKALPD
jgi:hypothetical protein